MSKNLALKISYFTLPLLMTCSIFDKLGISQILLVVYCMLMTSLKHVMLDDLFSKIKSRISLERERRVRKGNNQSKKASKRVHAAKGDNVQGQPPQPKKKQLVAVGSWVDGGLQNADEPEGLGDKSGGNAEPAKHGFWKENPLSLLNQKRSRDKVVPLSEDFNKNASHFKQDTTDAGNTHNRTTSGQAFLET